MESSGSQLCGFFLVVEFYWGGSATNGATPSRYLMKISDYPDVDNISPQSISYCRWSPQEEEEEKGELRGKEENISKHFPLNPVHCLLNTKIHTSSFSVGVECRVQSVECRVYSVECRVHTAIYGCQPSKSGTTSFLLNSSICYQDKLIL